MLQSLPAILQTYQADIKGDLLFLTLETCGILASNKAAVVASTAAATFHQLVSTVFERVATEDEDSDSPRSVEIQLGDQTIQVGPSASDAFYVLNDLCSMLEGGRAEFIGRKILASEFILEVLESIVASSTKVFRRHGELIVILRKRAVAAMIGILSEKQSFRLSVRAMRLLSLLIRNHLDSMKLDGEMILNFLIYLLDPDSASSWKRILSMEAWKSFFSDFRLLRSIYMKFDSVEGRKNILQDMMGAMVRIASEKPTVIGLGRQSTVPQRRGGSVDANDEQASIEALGVAGIVGSAVSAEATVTGISVEWSLPKSPFIDQIDKSEHPPVPETYIYSLVLGLLGSLSENMTRFLMPLSVPREVRSRRAQSIQKEEETDSRPGTPTRTDSNSSKRKHAMLLNPLTLELHSQFENIKVTAAMVETCWPAFLASCSTFLYAALDGEHYHGLIRAFQKLTQVAGVLRLGTPRDALLTTLGKAAVPPDAFDQVPGTPDDDGTKAPSANGSSERTGFANPPLLSPVSESRRPSLAAPLAKPSTLTTRNLLCLRALLNLGIALGPTLDATAWSILFSTLFQSELVIKISMQIKRQQGTTFAENLEDDNVLKENLGAEITAVSSATKKLFSATSEYPGYSLQNLLKALCSVAVDLAKLANADHGPSQTQPLDVPKTPTHRRKVSRKFSMTIKIEKNSHEELNFLLEKLPVILSSNKERLAQETPDTSGWSLLAQVLLKINSDTDTTPDIRLRSAELLGEMSLIALKLSNTGEPRSKAEIQKRALSLLPLQLKINDARHKTNEGKAAIKQALHGRLLQVLERIVQECGDELIAGWNIIFEIINSVFVEERTAEDAENDEFKPHRLDVSIDLVRTSFRSLQVLGSDYLDRLPSPCVLAYVTALHDFGAQKEDLNIALTSTTAFPSLIEFLREHMDGPPTLVSKAVLQQEALSKEIHVAANAIWLIAMRRLSELALDERDDVRNTAIRLLLRIFENCALDLSPEMWRDCSEVIFLRILDQYSQSGPASGSYVPSSISIAEDFARLLINHIDQLSKSSVFKTIVNRVLGSFSKLLELKNLNLDKSVFESTTSFLNAANNKTAFGEDELRETWRLCSKYYRMIEADSPNDSKAASLESNQSAFTVYIECLLQFCMVSEDCPGLFESPMAMSAATAVILKSRHPPYTSDVTKLAPEQEKTLCLLKRIYTRVADRHAEFFHTLVKLAQEPVVDEQPSNDNGRALSKRPTRIAFSGAVLRLVGSTYSKEILPSDVLNEWSALETLDCLRRLISCEDGREIKGEPPLWQVATSTSVEVIENLHPLVFENQSSYNLPLLTELVGHMVDIVEAILKPSPPTTSETTKVASPFNQDHEKFDIDAFRKIHTTIVPLLSSEKINDSLRHRYAFALFKASLLLDLFPEDLPKDIETSPLSNIYHIRNGYVDNPSPTSRPQIAYVAIDTLLALTSGHDLVPDRPSSQQINRHTLAHATTSYLILRTALPLKTFISDQPLRGLMPIPTSIKKEIHYIANCYIELESIPGAVPALNNSKTSSTTNLNGNGNGTDTTMTTTKSHLPHLHPFILEFWNVLKRTDGGGSTTGAGASSGNQKNANKLLWDVVERWMEDGAVYCGEARGIGVTRDEWWK